MPADWHAYCQFTGGLGTSRTKQLLGAYITGEMDGSASAGFAVTARDVEQWPARRMFLADL